MLARWCSTGIDAVPRHCSGAISIACQRAIGRASSLARQPRIAAGRNAPVCPAIASKPSLPQAKAALVKEKTGRLRARR
ncbi:hypothetical protein XAPC_3280 [Xanthomonas citri pv. punicae str. LMG 859]|nr:hypothetical protein XAPC_3280 [Xanthomonas citri pv. punicae str. LMG 859]